MYERERKGQEAGKGNQVIYLFVGPFTLPNILLVFVETFEYFLDSSLKVVCPPVGPTHTVTDVRFPPFWPYPQGTYCRDSDQSF
jgi:hypothetical protein